MEPKQSDQKSVMHRIGAGAERAAREAAIGASVGGALAGVVGLALGALGAGVAVALLGVAVVAGGLGYWSHRRSQASLRVLVEIERSVERLGAGERMARLDEASLGRSGFGTVARSFNSVLDLIGEVTGRVLAVVHRVGHLPERLTQAMSEIEKSADAQEEAVEETASLIANINNSMRDISERIERLQRAAEESASSILEMGSSVDEVARNTATLHEGVESTTSSVHEIGASIRQVADGADHVGRIAEETASSMLEMDRVVQEVSLNAREAAELTQRVTVGAEGGSVAVSETISDIQAIHDRTKEARTVVDRLAARIDEIGGILGVIGEINDETNLLSLNAAIIAAQAGEQGKAFLVVANHVKTLAKRTEASTRDIAKLIADVQSESNDAVEAMNAGISAIDAGVSRSEAAGAALVNIQSAAQEAFVRVEGIARATEEQSRSSRLVAESAQETSTQVQQISHAMSEQSKVSEQMLKRAESALEACRHVHRSTDEQRETGRYITESISSITDMIRLIRENADSHAQASDSVGEAVMRLLENAQKSGEQVPAINVMLRELRDGANEIMAELARFESDAESGTAATANTP